jgi:chromosome segregation ATPase
LKSSSQDSKTSEKLATSQQRLQVVTEALGNRESELRALTAKQNRLRSDLEAETQRLVHERTKRLDELEATHQSKLDRLRAAYPDLKEDIKHEQLELATVQSKITGAEAELWKHQEALTGVQAQVTIQLGNVEIYTSKLAGIQAQITDVSQRIAPLHAERLELENLVAVLGERRDRLNDAIGTLTSRQVEQETEHKRTLHNLESRAQEVSIKIQQDEKSWERSREDLAVRETKLNEREKTLEMRELKVNRDERNLARNHELLGL